MMSAVIRTVCWAVGSYECHCRAMKAWMKVAAAYPVAAVPPT